MKTLSSTLNNNNGFTSLLVVFSVAAIASVMIIQASVAFRANRILHKREAAQSKSHIHMHMLAQKLKRNFDMAALDPSCKSVGKGFEPLKLPGSTKTSPRLVCVNKKSGLCITDENLLSEKTPICISLSTDNMNWESGKSKSSTTFGKFKSKSTSSSSQATTKTSFIIPSKSSSQWKNCNNRSCVRLLLCPIGSKKCSIDEATAIQVVSLENS